MRKGWKMTARKLFAGVLFGALACSVQGWETPKAEQTAVKGKTHAEESAGRLEALRLQIAFLADPVLSGCDLRAEFKDGQITLKGKTPNWATQERALLVSRQVTGLKIRDEIKTALFGLAIPPKVAKGTLQKNAQTVLNNELELAYPGIKVEAHGDGVLIVTGPVVCLEDKLEVSKKLRKVQGCEVVWNRMETQSMKLEGKIVTLISSNGEYWVPGREATKDLVVKTEEVPANQKSTVPLVPPVKDEKVAKVDVFTAPKVPELWQGKGSTPAQTVSIPTTKPKTEVKPLENKSINSAVALPESIFKEEQKDKSGGITLPKKEDTSAVSKSNPAIIPSTPKNEVKAEVTTVKKEKTAEKKTWVSAHDPKASIGVRSDALGFPLPMTSVPGQKKEAEVAKNKTVEVSDKNPAYIRPYLAVKQSPLPKSQGKKEEDAPLLAKIIGSRTAGTAVSNDKPISEKKPVTPSPVVKVEKKKEAEKTSTPAKVVKVEETKPGKIDNKVKVEKKKEIEAPKATVAATPAKSTVSGNKFSAALSKLVKEPKKEEGKPAVNTGTITFDEETVDPLAPNQEMAKELKKKVETACGRLAKKVEAICKPDGTILIEVHIADPAMQPKVSEKVLTLPELSNPKVFLDIQSK